jgi:pimeloyl-ACP methyl ester carboxylesterase
LHGLGNSGATWEQVAAGLPDDVSFVIVDLLGFGDSPAPEWAVYNSKTQARALMKTLLVLGIRHRIILVGHSMGSLVAVEFAKRYPLLVKSLVLCSPPLYKADLRRDRRTLMERDELLKWFFELAAKDPSNIVRMARFATRAGLKNPDFDITKLNTTTYIAALRASIINQTAMSDIVKLSQPINILYGTLDMVVIGKNIRRVQKASPNIVVTKFIGPHEIIGRYVGRVTKTLQQILTGEA